MGKRRITEEGEPCWHCGAPVKRRTPKEKPRRGRAFYFEYYFECSNYRRCPKKFRYMPEEAKRFWSEKSEFDRASPAPSQESNPKLPPPENDFS